MLFVFTILAYTFLASVLGAALNTALGLRNAAILKRARAEVIFALVDHRQGRLEARRLGLPAVDSQHALTDGGLTDAQKAEHLEDAAYEADLRQALADLDSELEN